MTISRTSTENVQNVSDSNNSLQLEMPYELFLKNFFSITRYYALFQSAFFVIFVSEIFCFLCFLSLSSQSFFLASSIAIIFLTIFAYFVLRFYFQAKKPEQFLQLRENFLHAIKNSLTLKKESASYHLALAQALQKLSALLHGKEYSYFLPLQSLPTLQNLFQKLSAFLHWKEVQKMRELLLIASIEKHVLLVKTSPTDLDAHASLANAYLSLSKIYKAPPLQPSSQLWISSSYYSEEMKRKFASAAQRAIEEFIILDDYAPQDPWIHAQLASLYHDLERPQEEISEYEIMMKLVPQESKILYRLGVLYFQQGYTSKGLRMYEKLKKTSPEQAEELILFYDAYSLYEQEGV